MDVRHAAVGAVVAQPARGGPDVLSLVAHAVGALADLEIARLAEIVLPQGQPGVLPGGLVEHQRLVVALAAVVVALGRPPAEAPGAEQSPQFRNDCELAKAGACSIGKRICA